MKHYVKARRKGEPIAELIAERDYYVSARIQAINAFNTGLYDKVWVYPQGRECYPELALDENI